MRMYVCMHACMYLFMQARMHACMYVRTYVCTYYVCMYVWICAYNHNTHTRARARALSLSHTHTRAHTHTHTHTHTHDTCRRETLEFVTLEFVHVSKHDVHCFGCVCRLGSTACVRGQAAVARPPWQPMVQRQLQGGQTQQGHLTAALSHSRR